MELGLGQGRRGIGSKDWERRGSDMGFGVSMALFFHTLLFFSFPFFCWVIFSGIAWLWDFSFLGVLNSFILHFFM